MGFIYTYMCKCTYFIFLFTVDINRGVINFVAKLAAELKNMKLSFGIVLQ